MANKTIVCRTCDRVTWRGRLPGLDAETEYIECGQCHVFGPPRAYTDVADPMPAPHTAPPLVLTRAQLRAYRQAGVIDEREGGPTFGGVSIQVAEDIRGS